MRGRLGILGAVVLAGMAWALAAFATDYKGDIGHTRQLKLTIANGQVTALRGVIPVPCQDGRDDKVDVSLGAPVAVAEGSFHVEGTSGNATSEWSWSLDATVSPDGRRVSGSATISGRNGVSTCSGTAPVSAIALPHFTALPVNRTFEQGRPVAGSPDPGVSFDYRNGLITHLTARIGTKCPSRAQFDATFNTTAYGVDPVHVIRGAFRIETDVFNDHEYLTHVVLVGRIKGDKASGTVDAATDQIGYGHCVGHDTWRAYVPPKPQPYSSATAQTSLVGYRERRHGRWIYYVEASVSHCSSGTTAVRFSVLRGQSKAIRCARAPFVRTAKLILRPTRPYWVVVTALVERNGKVVARRRLAKVHVYLPARPEPCTFIGPGGGLPQPCPPPE